MVILLTIVHVFVCLVLIAIVLMQHGKGADIGVAFGGGGSNTVFGARGAGNFLTKLTTGSAIVFMITSFTLARFAVTSDVDEVLGAPLPASESPATPEGTEPPAPLEAPAPAEPPSSFEELPAAKPEAAPEKPPS